jgi:hypothetical protein
MPRTRNGNRRPQVFPSLWRSKPILLRSELVETLRLFSNRCVHERIQQVVTKAYAVPPRYTPLRATPQSTEVFVDNRLRPYYILTL